MTQSSLNSKPSQPRVQIVDAAKGIAIILMVLGHTEQGAMHRQVWANMPHVVGIVTFADAFIYSFHMPAFFFISGLFLARSVERRGRWRFVLEKSRTLLYPYVLWALLSFATDPLTLKFRSSGALPNWHERISGILTGNSSWFLITLFATQLLALLVLRLPHWLNMLVALAVSVLIPASGITILYKPFVFFPFVVAGIWFSAERVQRLAAISKSVTWTAFTVLLIMQLAIIRTWGAVNRWDLVPVGFTGIAMLIFCSAILGTGSNKAFCWYGQASLGIFILAPFFQGGARELVVQVFRMTNPVLYLTIITFAATTIPAVLWFSQDRLRIGWVFKYPAPRRKAPRVVEAHDHAIQ